jgi:murein DD-endopeptidase MepM/ murein hydrolase activator NlpD
MRFAKLAALEGTLFLVVLIGIFGLYRWHCASASSTPNADSALASGTPSAVSDAIQETPGEHTDTLPAESEETAPVAVTYPAIDLNHFLGRGVKVVVHEVKLGENYWSVAKKFNIDVQTLIGANPDMPFVSRVKQTLLVPDQKGVLHAVAKNENVKTIAALYDVKPEVVTTSNSISWWHGIKEGDVLFLPGVKPVRMNDQWRGYFSRRGFFGMPFATWGRGWSSKFGYRSDPLTGERRLHKGMDFRAKYGVDVFASASGTVIFAGVSGGYGNLIQIKHINGYITLYGHLSKILVHQGQKVKRGQLIGKVGATGRVTGPHLHFEIRLNGKAINPLPLI